MSSIFTSRVVDTIEIPHDAGQTVTIRKLAPRHLEAAAKTSQAKSLDALKEMGGPAFMKELQSVVPAPAQTAPATDPLLQFDRVVLMEKGVVAWTYDVPIRDTNGQIRRDEEGLSVFADLDDVTADFLGRAILMLAKPSLYQTQADAEAAQKNG
jgi:hypothetical protein